VLVLLARLRRVDGSGPSATSPSATAGSVIPADPCSVVSAADIEAAFGGTSTAARIDGDGNCSFDVSGTVHAGGTGDARQPCASRSPGSTPHTTPRWRSSATG